ncbi:MAG: rhomboid family intramembrane serine protease [Caldilineaceae bacterium]|nr:rhomboid family intramembrane serine protease [Caldilineaceae bacterium]
MYDSDPQDRGEIITPSPFAESLQPPSFYIPLAKPLVSRTLIGINLVVFAAVVIFELVVYRSAFGADHLRVLYFFGMKSNIDILNGEVWRLFTAMFLHIGPVHLISNLIGLLMLGPIIEGHFGHWRFAAIYLLGGLLGSIASYAFSPALSAGASGAIFGLLGATLIYFYRFRENFGQRGRDILQSMAVVLILNLFVGVSMNNVDNWGHMGGLVGGFLMTIGLMPRYRMPEVIAPGRQPLARDVHPVRDLLWTALYVGFLVLAFWLATLAGPPLR